MSQAHVFEEHAAVLAHWWALKAQGPLDVVYLDAHLDLQFVNPQRLARLRACTSASEVAELAKPHPLCLDAQGAYGIEDFLYPAAQLGLIGRLIWVAPPHVDLSDLGRALARLEQMEGVSPDELSSFVRRPDGWIEGRLLGLPVLMGRLEHLPDLSLPHPWVLDIDVDYLVAIPGDAVWLDPAELMHVLRALPGQPLSVSISRSVSSGFTPLRHRFVGDLLAALWRGDEAQASHLGRLLRLDRALQPGQADTTIAGCRAELADHPDCAATLYLLSLALAQTPGARDEADACLAAAQARCEAYRPDVLRELCQIRARRLSCDLGQLLAWARRVQTLSGPLDRQALAWAALGLLHAAFRQLEPAQACARQFHALIGHGHAELAVEIARLCLALGQADQAQPWLMQALDQDETRVTALVYLAQIWSQQGQGAQAIAALRQAQALSPAWIELSRLLGQALAAAGDPQAAQAQLAHHQALHGQRTHWAAAQARVR